jgi:hypothetical protein
LRGTAALAATRLAAAFLATFAGSFSTILIHAPLVGPTSD